MIVKHINKDSISRKALFAALMLLSLALALPGLLRRLSVEWSHRDVALVMDYRDIASLSAQAGLAPGKLFHELARNGMSGVAAAEFTGKDLQNGVMPLRYGAYISLPLSPGAASKFPSDRAALVIGTKSRFAYLAERYLYTKFPGTVKFTDGSNTVLVLPGTAEEYGDSGILPDFRALDFASSAGTKSLYRPAPAAGVGGAEAGASIEWLKKKYPGISCIIPAGLTLAGYPETEPLARTLISLDIPVAQAEFVKQIGAPSLYEAVKPAVIPLHSLVREEIFSRRLSRPQIVERMVRAVHERSIRILLLRPYDIYNAKRLEFFMDDMKSIKQSLSGRGYAFGWVKPLPMWDRSAAGAFACSVLLSACLWFHASRYGRKDGTGDSGDEGGSGNVTSAECMILGISIALIGLASWKIPFAGRYIGGFAAAMTAVEATLWALGGALSPGDQKPFRGLLAGLAVTMTGGLVISSFYGTPEMMLRLSTFSGVKLTLLLPPLLVLLHDLKSRIHPESVPEVLSRPPMWGELIICGILLLSAAFMAVRSDNATLVPGWEITLRDTLERLLWIRPRTKEFLIGYPSLVVYYAVIRRGWLKNYREVLRIASSLAFASAINTFCHMHTLLPLNVIRVVNGWWFGIAIGFIIVVIMNIAAPLVINGMAGTGKIEKTEKI